MALSVGNVVARDTNSIRMGSEMNIHDHFLVTIKVLVVLILLVGMLVGNKITIGHGTVIHTCTVEDGAFVGISATLLDCVVVEQGAFAFVATRIFVIWVGNPTKLLRELKGDKGTFIPESTDHYSELDTVHIEANVKSFHDLITVQEVYNEAYSSLGCIADIMYG